MIKKLSDRFFKWFCNPEYYLDISGDLDELYHRSLSDHSKTLADFRYLGQVLVMLRPSLIRPLFKNSIINTGMFSNYLKIGFRNLAKHKVYSTINILGLAVGLAGFLLINQFISFEKSYDRFFKESDQLVRLSTDQVVDGVLGVRDAMSFNPSGKVLVEALPEVTDYTTTYKFEDLAFKGANEVVNEKGVVGADEHYLDLFNYKIIESDGSDLLSEPNTLVLTQSKARKYFGNESAIGKSILIHSGFEKSFKVVGVIEDLPENTHYHFGILMSLVTIKDILEDEAWRAFNYYTYLKVTKETNLAELNEKLVPLSRKHIGEESTLNFVAVPVADIHLQSNFTYEPEEHGNEKTVTFLSVISIFILIIAWVNYINLSTARAVDRAKEVGLRKVIGAQKTQLVVQFFVEALIINFLGALLAAVLAELSLPYFNKLVGKELINHIWENSRLISVLIMFFFLGTVVSGAYPALVLSGFRPVEVLKGKFRNSTSGILLRKGLVVVQFCASLILLGSTIVVYQQVQHMQSKDLGINIDQVIGFPSARVAEDREEENINQKKSFFERLKSNNNIVDVAQMTHIPGGNGADIWSSSGSSQILGVTEKFVGTTYIQAVDDHAMQLLGFQLLHGRYFDRTLQSDTAAIILNEACLERYNIKIDENLLSQKFKFGDSEDGDRFHIVGIVKDVNRTTAKNNVEPTAYFYSGNPDQTVVRLSAQNIEEGLNYLEETWAEFFPQAALDYVFVDSRFERLYEGDKRFGDVFAVFSLFAILVAALGLFGLASFLAIQRAKEIGVRKVLGASISQILGIFLKDFVLLIGVAAIIGSPVIYFAMDIWLDNYAYRIDFPWYVLAVSVVLLTLVAFTTIGYQTFRVAKLNPAITLKDE